MEHEERGCDADRARDPSQQPSYSRHSSSLVRRDAIYCFPSRKEAPFETRRRTTEDCLEWSAESCIVAPYICGGLANSGGAFGAGDAAERFGSPSRKEALSEARRPATENCLAWSTEAWTVAPRIFQGVAIHGGNLNASEAAERGLEESLAIGGETSAMFRKAQSGSGTSR